MARTSTTHKSSRHGLLLSVTLWQVLGTVVCFSTVLVICAIWLFFSGRTAKLVQFTDSHTDYPCTNRGEDWHGIEQWATDMLYQHLFIKVTHHCQTASPAAKAWQDNKHQTFSTRASEHCSIPTILCTVRSVPFLTYFFSVVSPLWALKFWENCNKLPTTSISVEQN